MSQLLFKIALYLLSVAIGFYVFPVFTNIMIVLEAMPALEDGALGLYTQNMLKGAIWFWLGGVISGLFYFWLKSGWRFLFLCLPVILPLGYCIFYILG